MCLGTVLLPFIFFFFYSVMRVTQGWSLYSRHTERRYVAVVLQPPILWSKLSICYGVITMSCLLCFFFSPL